MAFWSRFSRSSDGVTPNDGGPSGYSPGDPDGFIYDPPPPVVSIENRSVVASPWDGWPEGWETPAWGSNPGLNRLVDTAWACLDLNASVLASMPLYRLRSGQILPSLTWMQNPDPDLYASWSEFAKQLFWDYQMGEAFILATAWAADGSISRMRVVEPWMVTVDIVGGRRSYKIGALDVTDDILHIRYTSTLSDARGHGPLEVGGARMVAARLLGRYMAELAETGGRPIYWLEVERRLSKPEADDALTQWVESRARNLGKPALLSGGTTLGSMPVASAKDMALLELAQFSESRIAVLLGVPPFLVGLPSGGDSMTYSNVSSLFDFHDRSSLRPKAATVMGALSNWALVRGQSVELNRDEYTRPDAVSRSTYYKTLHDMDAIDGSEVRSMERLHGATPGVAARALTGGEA